MDKTLQDRKSELLREIEVAENHLKDNLESIDFKDYLLPSFLSSPTIFSSLGQKVSNSLSDLQPSTNSTSIKGNLLGSLHNYLSIILSIFRDD